MDEGLGDIVGIKANGIYEGTSTEQNAEFLFHKKQIWNAVMKKWRNPSTENHFSTGTFARIPIAALKGSLHIFLYMYVLIFSIPFRFDTE